MLRVLIMGVVLTLCPPAFAEKQIGVVVGGADAIRAQTESAIGSWLGEHALEIAPAPLPKDGIKTLLNCLVLGDMTCARGVVEARGTATNVIGILEQVSGKREKRSVQISAYWVAKHHDVVSLQRTCDACTDAVLAKTIDTMIGDLARVAPTMGGKIHVTSQPPGVTAMIDNQPIGVTPADHDVPFGRHTVALSRDGKVLTERQVDVGPSATVETELEVPKPAPAQVVAPVATERRSRTLPVVMIGFGVAGVITGAVLYSRGPTGAAYLYRDTKPAGIAVAASGGLLAVVGAILLLRHGSGPDVQVMPGGSGAVVGWAGSF